MKRYIWNSPTLIERRKILRNNCTVAESLLWEKLKGSRLGVKFRRQHSVGPYILDFYCPVKKLAIELDGNVHIGKEEIDEYRTRTLKEHEVNVVRFKNEDVEKRMGEVIKKITTYLNPPS